MSIKKTMVLQKDSEIVALVSGMGMSGEGIIKLEGFPSVGGVALRSNDGVVCKKSDAQRSLFTIFVPFALPGEKVRVKITKLNKNFAHAKVLKIILPADERVRPPCKVFETCGGCRLQHYKYGCQLRHKSRFIAESFHKIAHLKVTVAKCVKSEKYYEYRNKFQFFTRSDNNDDIITGLFMEDSKNLTEISECPIAPLWSKIIIAVIKSYLTENGLGAYNAKTGEGYLKSVIVREVDSRLLITLIINGDNFLCQKELVKLLDSAFSKYSLFYNVNKELNSDIPSDNYICVKGFGKILAGDFGLKCEVGPGTFMQVNDGVSHKLYARILKYAEAGRGDTVVNAYSGVGVLTALFARECKKAYGIEIVENSHNCAETIRVNNQLKDKMINILGDCAEMLPPLLKKLQNAKEKITLVLNPPKKGCDEKLLNIISDGFINKILYISCNPATLARDIGVIKGSLKAANGELKKNADYKENESKYLITHIQPFDMFPQTKHVETLVCLQRK